MRIRIGNSAGASVRVEVEGLEFCLELNFQLHVRYTWHHKPRVKVRVRVRVRIRYTWHHKTARVRVTSKGQDYKAEYTSTNKYKNVVMA